MYDEAATSKNILDLGVRDVIVALEWVHQNARQLGGDSENITLFGQSAGASITQMLLDERPELFRRAILHSAPCDDFRDPATAETVREFARKALPQGKTFESASVDDLLDAQSAAGLAAMKLGMRIGWRPVAYHSSVWGGRSSGKHTHDVLIGWTCDDHLIFYELGNELNGIKPPEGEEYARQIQETTERTWGGPARRLAARLIRRGDQVGTFRMDWRPEGSRFGATHTADLPLLFGDEASWKDAPMLGTVPYSEWSRRGKQLRKAWANFARSGTFPSDVEGFSFNIA